MLDIDENRSIADRACPSHRHTQGKLKNLPKLPECHRQDIWHLFERQLQAVTTTFLIKEDVFQNESYNGQVEWVSCVGFEKDSLLFERKHLSSRIHFWSTFIRVGEESFLEKALYSCIYLLELRLNPFISLFDENRVLVWIHRLMSACFHKIFFEHLLLGRRMVIFRATQSMHNSLVKTSSSNSLAWN